MDTMLLFLGHLIPALEALRHELEEVNRQVQLQARNLSTRVGAEIQTNASGPKSVTKQTLSVPEASAMLGLRRSTLYKYTCQRVIPYYKLGSRILFDEQKLRSWMESRAVEPLSAGGPKRAGPRTQPQGY
jgi:excisionase family DNA binding protein